jgi:ATP-binding cassette, subfamily F, member 3
MDLIKATKLNLHNGSKDILINVDFRILEGQKYGLIGPNGVGKTSLIRLLLGEDEADSGTLYKNPGLKVGYLPQQPLYDKKQPIEEFLLTELSPIMKRLRDFEELMSRSSAEDLEKVLIQYQKECDLFEDGGGYGAIEKGEILLKQLGMDNSLKQEMGTLSGGERSLVFFARALLASPDLLILDEPGNHLDYLGLAWLESFIGNYPGSVLIVSHNRYLLDKTCSVLFDMFAGKMKTFTGNYSSYRIEKYRTAIIEQSEYESSQKKMEKLIKEIKQLQSIAMSQYNPPATVMSKLGAAKRKLAEEKSKNLEKPRIEDDAINISFGDENSKSRIAMQVKDFNWAFDDKVLFENAELEIHSREKVALVGPNGSGKTTFINAVLNHADWNERNLRIGPSQIVGYLSQVPVFSEQSVTIEDEVRSWGTITQEGAFSIAKNFSFTYQDMEKRLAVLSGGEVNRLQLARLMYHKTNFLILDEPTNHMDIQSREMIEEAVKKFKGTVLVVSHDRFFLDQLVDRVIEIDDKKLKSFPGNFSEYFKAKYPALPRLSGEIKKRGGERKKENNDLSTNTFHLETRIQEAEDEKADLEQDLKESFANNDHQKGRKIASKLEKLTSRLEKLYSQWEKIS